MLFEPKKEQNTTNSPKIQNENPSVSVQQPEIPSSFDQKNVSVIQKNSVIEGSIKADCMVVEGTVLGNIVCGDLIIRNCANGVGDIFAHDLVLWASIEGNITCTGKLDINQGTYVKGNITADSIICAGEINGNVVSNNLFAMKSESALNGDCKAKRFSIEEGAILNGSLSTIR